ncbi:MAG: dihydrofolate reductase family protein [Acidobacteriota bacterium]
MQELRYYVATSLDGFIARGDGSFDDFVWDDELVADFMATVGTFSAVLMGRKTYDVGLREGKTSPYPHLQQLVFSRSMDNSPDPAVELVREGAVERVREVKAQDGDGVWLCGGGELATLCLKAGLIDRLTLKLNPVVFGKGTPLFTERLDVGALEHTGRRAFESGIVQMEYRLKT